jgi:predicted CXXCH cytochrome family protein
MTRSWLQLLLLTCGAAVLLSLAACGRGTAPTTAPAPAATQAVAPAPKPTVALAKNASCITDACHARFGNAKQIHQPVAVNACFSCHQADAGGHRYPLARTGNATCTFCHAVAGTKQVQHKALAEQGPGVGGAGGGCTNCHDPHAARTKFLLKADSVGALCAKCHETPMKKHAHEPFAAGQCTVCHQPHEADNAGLLRNGTGATHCFSCHADKQKAFAEMPHVHKVSAQNCLTCHGPHATDFPRQLKKSANDTCLSCHTKIQEQIATAKVAHGAVASGCVTCHDPHAASQPNELRSRMDKVCLTCHDKAQKTADGRVIESMSRVLAASNLHGPVRSGSCSECHNPHGADEPNLLRKYFPDKFYASFDVKNYALCFGCHDQQLVLKPRTDALTNFRDGDRNLHFVHVNRAEKGRTCKTCHEMHGSDLPKHMASSVQFEGSGWAMPIKYEPAADGGTCTPGCHDEKSYRRSKAANSTTLPAPSAGPQPATRGAP